MENVFLTSLTVPEVREQFRRVLTEFFSELSLSSSSLNIHEPEQRFTRAELAKYLGVTLPTIDRYRSRNVLPYYQTGRTIFFKKSEVDNALLVRTNKKHQ